MPGCRVSAACSRRIQPTVGLALQSLSLTTKKNTISNRTAVLSIAINRN
jgi:hypothetical protein